MNRTNTLITVGAFFFSILACNQTQPQKVSFSGVSAGIIHGDPVQKDELPYKMTARLLTLSNGNVWYPVCTASILADDLILTAAHCVEGETAARMRIGFDAQPLTYEGQSNHKTRVDVVKVYKTVLVDSFIVHPMYQKSEYDQDMALIHLKGKIPAGFSAAQLMTEKQLKAIDEKAKYQVLLVGFGLLEEEPQVESDILRQTTVPAKFEGLHVVTDQTKSGGCFGDSGGPAYLKVDGALALIGVTHGPKVENQDCHHLGVWGNPSFEKNFLNESAHKMGSTAKF